MKLNDLTAAALLIACQDGSTLAGAASIQLDQGLRVIKFSWIKDLCQANGQPFLADSLRR